MVAERDFLSTITHLAERRHPEDQLSNTFAACFNQSAAFRNAAVRLLRLKHGFGHLDEAGTQYECAAPVWESNGQSNSRYDLVLRPRDRGRSPTFTLESKLGSALTQSQLRKYRAGRVGHLTAITQYFPDVSIRWLRANKIRWLRWHEIHRALVLQQGRMTAVDKFLCKSFASYLEGRGMSSSSITARDLRNIGAMFRAISNSTYATVNCLAFPAAAQLIDLLQEVKRELEDVLGKKHALTGWGPGYFNDKQDHALYHYLGFELRRVNPSLKRQRLVAFFQFPESSTEKVRWEVYGFDYRTKEVVGDMYFDQSASRLFDKSGHLTSDNLVASVRGCVKRWRPQFL